ncbi:Multisubunit Na+/H+ antiporter, MnhF subunit [Rickettsia massiliae MTU5]|uniref:Multisubunit Na+/H+ antiporter, MnhF subunit n=2 Tax=spotted fever group TaxID=114277 RepID=A8F239_RICM5|nr:Multisubunit Na+/H+ antiporter, MnhF subunit [Rickettsia massiliae MTU5]
MLCNFLAMTTTIVYPTVKPILKIMLNIFLIIISLFICLITYLFISKTDIFTNLLILNSFTTLASLFICCLGLYSGNSSYLDIAIIYFLLSFIATNGYLKYFINESNEKKTD